LADSQEQSGENIIVVIPVNTLSFSQPSLFLAFEFLLPIELFFGIPASQLILPVFFPLPTRHMLNFGAWKDQAVLTGSVNPCILIYK
jgi:hypothetical protein